MAGYINMEDEMKYLVKVIIITLIPLVFLFSQNKLYWKDAPIQGTKIYSIKFFDAANGVANSEYAETLFTNDGGEHWVPINYAEESIHSENYLWRVDIYCSVMKTSDSGVTWKPYLLEPQEHFCMAYFKDENTNLKVAEEFLSKVVNVINESLTKGVLDSLVNSPIQCTEYYTDAQSGWALGWCIRSFENSVQM